MTPRLSVLVASLLLFSACFDEVPHSTDSPRAQDSETGDPVYPSLTNFCRTMTISGNVFYNDLRTHGRFSLRDREGGGTGAAEPYGDGDDRNYLALRDAQVDLYEVDTTWDARYAGCEETHKVGSATVQKDGSFTWTGQVCEYCGTDPDGGQDASLSIGAKVLLRHCTDPETRCFSVADPQGDGVSDHYQDEWGGVTWSKWMTGASNTQPKQTAGTSPSLGTTYFEGASPTSQSARAANVFSSLVDVTRKMHLQAGVAFGRDEVVTYFPNVIGGIAHSHETGRLCVTDPGAGDWLDGDVEMHEYGHLLHYWEWANQGKWVSYAYDSNGDGFVTPDETEESYSQQEYANAAFKEGWADFVAGVTLDNTGSWLGCDGLETGNDQACPGGICPQGRHYFSDVTSVLCDLWDTESDCETRGGVEYCDTTDLTVNEMLDALHDVWIHASQTDRDIVIDADANDPAILGTFGVCTLFDELSNVGETFKVSGLDCGS